MTYGIANPNGLKTQEATLGMPEAGYVVVTINGVENSFNVEGEYEQSDSNFARAVNAVGMFCEVYAVYEPESAQLLVQVRGDSMPLSTDRTLGDGGTISVMSSFLTEVLGFAVTVWNARMSDDQVTWDF